jgi:hypothetical protein
MRTMTDADKRVAGQLELAKRARGFTNETLAVAIGRPGKAGRNWVQQCCSAVRPVTIGELEGSLPATLRTSTGTWGSTRSCILTRGSHHLVVRR